MSICFLKRTSFIACCVLVKFLLQKVDSRCSKRTGRTPSKAVNKQLACNLSVHERLDEHLARFWKIDEVQQVESYSVEEKQVEKHFVATHSRDPTGRFIVKLPFKQESLCLGNFKDIALKRFHSLERKLHKQPRLSEQYTQFITEYFHLGHMSVAAPDDNGLQTSYYLPHHSVLKEDSLSTKLRVAFNASAKTTSGKSLNDI
ncbi:uncharacterized protein LOC108735896 [Agrilus planipennis]|uniref:Uncharacterized protein LOC108735896 n=1 Tax=Agrilus planipennis TaxID=224129 RepID=A0A1W4WSZ4_AGRPL|nr:uncharacterized protein LOC108735896 [Agrilus planipennis]